MSKHAKIFKRVNERSEFNYSQVQIAQWSKLQKSFISRFLTNESDVSLSKFFQLINSMPLEFQRAYWKEALGIKILSQSESFDDWRSQIKNASKEDIADILGALGDKWSEMFEEGKEEGKIKEELAKAS